MPLGFEADTDSTHERTHAHTHVHPYTPHCGLDKSRAQFPFDHFQASSEQLAEISLCLRMIKLQQQQGSSKTADPAKQQQQQDSSRSRSPVSHFATCDGEKEELFDGFTSLRARLTHASGASSSSSSGSHVDICFLG